MPRVAAVEARGSNRLSLSVSLFALLALYAPTQMPSGARNGWVGNVLLRADPFTAGMRYLDQLIINGHGVRQDADWLLGPLVSAVVVPGAALAVASRLSPRLGNRS